MEDEQALEEGGENNFGARKPTLTKLASSIKPVGPTPSSLQTKQDQCIQTDDLKL